eukprot:3061221-Pyramimonas_sp.AAC.1
MFANAAVTVPVLSDTSALSGSHSSRAQCQSDLSDLDALTIDCPCEEGGVGAATTTASDPPEC